MAAHHIVIPSARRLMASLRDIGYDLPAAIADIVDNSIDADALTVRIDMVHAGPESHIRIADDGVGMTERELDEAMRYGSRRTYGDDDLGHFGLGLKTASLSQCRRLTVASRSTSRGRIQIRRWDLDRVAARDAWELERLTPSECPPHLLEPLAEGSGTVVLWDHLDRVMAYRRPDGEAARAAIERAEQETEEHLAMVFHRFLAGQVSGPSLDILLNGSGILAWDPFATHEPMTQRLPRQALHLEHDGERHTVSVQPYVLPNQHHFSTPAAHAAASGPKMWNRQQGLYIYRHDRLIQSGGWNRLRTMDEHSKLARVALDIPTDADAAFQANVSKMTVTLPDELRPTLRALLAGVIGRAQDTYRQRVQLVPTPDAPPPSPDSDWHLGDHWTTITDVLERELADHPDILERILISLINGPSPHVAAVVV